MIIEKLKRQEISDNHIDRWDDQWCNY